MATSPHVSRCPQYKAAIAALALHGKRGMTLSDAVQILVDCGIRPASVTRLEVAMTLAKRRMTP